MRYINRMHMNVRRIVSGLLVTAGALLASCTGAAERSSTVLPATQRAGSTGMKISFSFDQRGLEKIRAEGKQVAIAGDVEMSQRGLPIIWLVFRPLLSDEITWNDDVNYVYASLTTPQPGTKAVVVNSMQADRGFVYLFDHWGFYGSHRFEHDGYAVANMLRSNHYVAFGLLRPAIVNGSDSLGPLNFVSLGYNGLVTFKPTNSVSIFLTKDGQHTLLKSIPGDALTIHLSHANRNAGVHFDDATMTFKKQ